MNNVLKVFPQTLAFNAQPTLVGGVLKTLGYGTGGLVIIMAMAVYMTQTELSVIFDWLEKVFSASFVVVYLGLMALGILAGIRLDDQIQSEYWFEVGQQAAGGVATLALTFTLLGLSMGIGSLTNQQITPESISEIIGGLTEHFSTAFMTTVVGLPSANALRAFISIRQAKLKIHWQSQNQQRLEP